MPKSTPRLIDTNLIIRYLVEEDSKKADAVEKLLKNPDGKLVLTDVTFAEIIWVLSSYYGLKKEKIIQYLSALLKLNTIIANRTVLYKALEYFLNYNLSYIDAYQAGYAAVKKMDIYSYDKDFNKLGEIKRFEP